MSNRSRAAILVLVALVIGCQKPPPPQLLVLRRFADELPEPRLNSRATSAPGFTGLEGVRRPVLAASQSLRPAVTCPSASEPPDRHARCVVAVPKTAARASAWILETAPIALLRANAKRAAGRKVSSPSDVRRRVRIVMPPRRSRDSSPSVELPAWLIPFARLWPAPSIPLRDFLSHPFVVPQDAVLTFAIGTEEPAWHVDAPAVDFAVEARTPAGPVDLYSRVLDPRHRLADRGWHEATVSLAPVAGESVRIRLTVRPVKPGSLAPQLPVWSDPTVLVRATPTERRRPSVVLISLDTLRAKSVSAFGHERSTTPFLERFSRSATRFPNTFTTYSNTFGAHISMLTGVHPSAHVKAGGGHSLSPKIETLAERLRAAGYATAAFTEDALLDATAGFEKGFSHYWENKTVGTGAGDARGTFARAIDWLTAHNDRPVFLFAHTYAVHAPYDPTPPYDTMFVNEGNPAPTGNLLAYEQEIRELDDDMASLIGRLDDLLDPRETLLIVTADHGEEFGEHGGLLHVQLYDEVLHIPLWMRWPGHVPAGRSIDALTSLVDVKPTVLDLLGLDPGGKRASTLKPILRGEADRLDRPMVLAEAPPSPWSMKQWSYVARTLTAKCMVLEDPSLDRCYDLTTDPGETEPAPETGELAGLHKVARVFADAAIKSRGRKRTFGPRPKAPEVHADPERLEKLRALGYVE